MDLARVPQPSEVVDGTDKRAQREVIVTGRELALDRLGRDACRHPGMRGPASFAQEATDLRLASARERGNAA